MNQTDQTDRTGCRWLLAERTWLIALTGVSGLIGVSVPGFYDWTGADQSRPVALMWQVPLGVALVSCAVGIALFWIPIEASHADTGKLRFGVRSLLAMAIAIAIGVAVWLRYPNLVGGVCLAVACLAGGGLFLRHRDRRLAITTLLACNYLPLLWMAGDLPPVKSWELLALSGFPALLPAMMINEWLIGGSPDGGLSIALICTAVLLIVGWALIRCCVKASIAYMLFVLVVSGTGSLMANALMRM